MSDCKKYLSREGFHRVQEMPQQTQLRLDGPCVRWLGTLSFAVEVKRYNSWDERRDASQVGGRWRCFCLFVRSRLIRTTFMDKSFTLGRIVSGFEHSLIGGNIISNSPGRTLHLARIVG